jgi:branched-chain amino acid transport system substrate-binding protein
LYVNNDYGYDQAKAFENLFEDLGGNIIAIDGFAQGTIEFRNLLEKIKALQPQAVFIPAYTEAGYILKQAFEIELRAQFIGSAPLENPEILKIAGQGGEGAIYPHHFDPESQNLQVQEFIKKYKLRFGEEPEGYAALAYDGLYVISHVLKQCNQDKECIKLALYQMQNFPGITGSTSFDDHGDVLKPIVIRKIRNGLFRTLWREEAP